jgi:hypothetical protein
LRDDVLIVLDDFDRLLPEGAGYVQALLDAAPNAKILATSQEPLGLAVEQTLLLPPLPAALPRACRERTLKQYPSVALVLQQAGEPFQLTPTQGASISAGMHSVGGHPSHLVRLGLLPAPESRRRVETPDAARRCLTHAPRRGTAHPEMPAGVCGQL